MTLHGIRDKFEKNQNGSFLKKLVHGVITCVVPTKTSELVMHNLLIKCVHGAITCVVVPKKNATLDMHDLLKYLEDP
jgi:hypothetical protein